ncbi:hypothetical protein LV779_35280 [Streptomyces thinghirensis]|nr:hypothetical protein [Streptomyces thinghirensis]
MAGTTVRRRVRHLSRTSDSDRKNRGRPPARPRPPGQRRRHRPLSRR